MIDDYFDLTEKSIPPPSSPALSVTSDHSETSVASFAKKKQSTLDFAFQNQKSFYGI